MKRKFGDPVVEIYMRDIDRTPRREILKLAPSERRERFCRFMASLSALRAADGNRRRREGR
jgi:hypothetical protein